MFPLTELWSPTRVAEELNISRRMVYQLIAQGDLESARLGVRTIRVPRRSVEALIQRRLMPARRGHRTGEEDLRRESSSRHDRRAMTP